MNPSLTKDDGGAAFPRAQGEEYDAQDGMTLRDWFAGQALASIAGTVTTATVTSIQSAAEQIGYSGPMGRLRCERGLPVCRRHVGGAFEMSPFHHHGDISELSLFLIGMAAVGMVLIAIGAR